MPHLDKAFVQGLREFGWHEGQNILIEWRYADGSTERLPGLVAELIRLQVDLFVSFNNPSTVPLKEAAPTIPIVMRFAIDPIGQGFVKSLAQPGGNITGLTWDPSPEIGGKYLELLKEVVPHPSRVAGVIDPTYPGLGVYRNAATSAAQTLGLTLQHVEVRKREDLENAFATVNRERAQAVLVYGSAWQFAARQTIAGLATKHRLPAIFIWEEAVQAGGLISYGTNLYELHRRASYFVDKILKGAKPADLPIEQPTKFELVINLRTAKELGLTIPPSLLLRADQVIE